MAAKSSAVLTVAWCWPVELAHSFGLTSTNGYITAVFSGAGPLPCGNGSRYSPPTAQWAEQPLDQQLLAEVQGILQPIHNWHHIEGRPENND